MGVINPLIQSVEQSKVQLQVVTEQTQEVYNTTHNCMKIVKLREKPTESLQAQIMQL
uniref:Uncharacterized protein n=1 Tax=Picea glauca TaxID=3330 RepID=A0A101LU65_PICGL|nr:hypothetical protein ABT39_MTgene2706 [Picea glauca]KUM46068.1 hypothetical protein ABT39_MTgene1874 [Picea glauca]KUM51045.1 hypothetical protein ABT39_MTgene891 [Picea glauca]